MVDGYLYIIYSSDGKYEANKSFSLDKFSKTCQKWDWRTVSKNHWHLLELIAMTEQEDPKEDDTSVRVALRCVI